MVRRSRLLPADRSWRPDLDADLSIINLNITATVHLAKLLQGRMAPDAEPSRVS